ncbi:MAG: GTPase HflX [Propionibacteriaceae bacterium]|jgi:GTP-binding protein HflX|nr:GTPase HflX [Propionibacteriaceae bacterium]
MTVTESDLVDRGELERDERHRLRRVAAIRTELADVTEVEYRRLRLERVVLVGVGTPEQSDDDVERSLAELRLLAQTAGSDVLDGLVQRRSSPDPATFIGRGKVEELKAVVEEEEADTVICDGELTPAQLRTLEDRVGVKVVDRTALILDIFAQHAHSAKGKTQVELAQLRYLRQRLRGWGGNLSRQVGGRASGGVGIGGRGPGETKIETDRRRIRTRIARLREQLRKMDETRRVGRQERVRHAVPAAAIVGYTNAGKSSLLNRVAGSDVLVEDALFATLDPTTRRVTAADGWDYTLTDTVGFIRKLPADLLEAFRSTLEESADADLLVHVVDATDPDVAGQISAVRTILSEVGAGAIPELLVVNKIDAIDEAAVTALRGSYPDAVFVSAWTGEGVDALRERIEALLPRPSVTVDVVIPYDRGDLVEYLYRSGVVTATTYEAEGTRLVADVTVEAAGQVEAYRAAPTSDPVDTTDAVGSPGITGDESFNDTELTAPPAAEEGAAISPAH